MEFIWYKAMARLVRNAKLDSRSARAKLPSSKVHGDVYWQPIEPGIAIGYWKPLRPRAGSWWVRKKIAGQNPSKSVLGVADDYADADGKKVLDYGQAQRKAIAWERGVTENPASRSYTVADAVDDWFSDYESRSRSLVSVKEQRHKNNVIIATLGSYKVADLTIEILNNWKAGIVKSGRTVRSKIGGRKEISAESNADPRESKRRRQATANRQLSTIKAALNFAWDNDKISSNPIWRKVKPYKGADQARVRHLTIDESIRLINACPSDFRQLVHAAILTGCRWGELRMMLVGDFSASSKTILLRHTKANKDRQVPLTDEGCNFFKKLTLRRNQSELMFLRPDGSGWGIQDQKRPMRAACAAAKIEPAIGFHILRHTYGSLLAQQGASMAVIAKAMGHADSRMTERNYAHIGPSHVAETIRKKLPVFIDE